jgi:DNA-binding NarL/FixJ family response regulator
MPASTPQRRNAAPVVSLGASTTRVLLADRAGPARRAVADVLNGLDDTMLVGEVDSRTDVAEAVRRLRVDVVVIDDRLLPAQGHVLDGSGPLVADVRTIVMGVDDHPAFAARARSLGAAAWIAKANADEELPLALARR